MCILLSAASSGEEKIPLCSALFTLHSREFTRVVDTGRFLLIVGVL